MANILIIPSSGDIYFDTGSAGSSTVANLSGSGVLLGHDGASALVITSYNTGDLDRFAVDGYNGRLFSVTDQVTGDIFSVNDAAGLPIINVYSASEDIVTIGEFGSNALVISGNSGIGMFTGVPSEALHVNGNIAVEGTVDGRDLAADGSVIDGLGTISTYNSGDYLHTARTATYTPSADYHPSTKKYVDDHAAVSATTTTEGHVELATDAEAHAATDTTRAVTPSNLLIKKDGTAIVAGDFTGNSRGSNALDVQSSRSAATQVASGSGSSVVGINNTASGSFSSAIGYNNTASGYRAYAFGYGNVASGNYCSAFGYNNSLSGNYGANAFGYGNTVSSYFASAFGWQSTASGSGSSAFGYANTASGGYSSAFGKSNTASGYNSSAFGRGNAASGSSSSAFGYFNPASGSRSSAFGYNNVASGSDSTAVGKSNAAIGTSSSLVGNSNREINGGTATFTKNSLFGYDNEITSSGTVTIQNCTIVGYQNTWTQSSSLSNATAIGKSNVASGSDSTALGSDNSASAIYATAVGRNNTASQGGSSAVGYNNTASGNYGTSAFGYGNTASGNTSSAIGQGNTASANYGSTAIGYSNTASGFAGMAFGNFNLASGIASNAFGYVNTASGGYGSAFGKGNTASSYNTSAFGYGNTASGGSSSAFGYQNTASGSYSAAIGYRAKTTVNNTFEAGYWSGATTRSSAIRCHPNGQVAMTIEDSASAPTDGGATAGSEADGTLPREMVAFRKNGSDLYVDSNTSGTVSTFGLGIIQSARLYSPRFIQGFTTGSGLARLSGQASADTCQLLTGTTTGSTAAAGTGGNIHPINGAAFDGDNSAVINFSRKQSCLFKFSSTASTSCVGWIFWGGPFNSAWTGGPTGKSIGLKLDGNALKLVAHDGSSVTTGSSILTMTANITYEILIVSDGSGNLEAFRNGTSLGTITGAPTGSTAAPVYPTAQAIIDNGATTTNASIRVLGIDIIAGETQ